MIRTLFEHIPEIRGRAIRSVRTRKGVCSRGCIAVSALLLLNFSPLPGGASELKEETVEAFNRYIRATDARMDAELRRGPFLWVDSLPEPPRQGAYDLLQRGQLEIREEKTQEDGKSIEVPEGLIHDWIGLAFVAGVSLERALTFLQDYDTHWRTYKPEV